MHCAAGDAEIPLLERVEHRYADNEGVSIHYVSLGSGPLIVMLHGFPDYKRNYPRPAEPGATRPAEEEPVVKVQAPVLMIHGLDD